MRKSGNYQVYEIMSQSSSNFKTDKSFSRKMFADNAKKASRFSIEAPRDKLDDTKNFSRFDEGYNQSIVYVSLVFFDCLIFLSHYLLIISQ